MLAELYLPGGSKFAVREYDSAERCDMDAWQYNWILFDTLGDVRRYVIRGDDNRAYKDYEKVE